MIKISILLINLPYFEICNGRFLYKSIPIGVWSLYLLLDLLLEDMQRVSSCYEKFVMDY